jgi:transposase InsO family protein
VGLSTLNNMIHRKLVNGMTVVGDVFGKCMACVLGKFKRTSYPSQPAPKGPLVLLHSDVCGPLPPGLNGHKYFVTVRDRFSGYTLVKTIKEKNESGAFIIHCIELLERGSPYTVKAIRMDRGGEYVSQSLLSWLSSKGIVAQHTATECSESNGTAERLNLTIMDRVRATLNATNQPRLLWPWIVDHVATAINFVPYAGRPNTTPHHDIFKSKPDISFLRTFGCKVVVHLPTQSQPDKLSARGAEGRLVGYVANSSSMYQVMYSILVIGRMKFLR